MKSIVLSLWLVWSFSACAGDLLILHKGDPFPPADVEYSYDSKETEADFARRRKMVEDMQRKGKELHEVIEHRKPSPEGGGWKQPCKT